MSEVERRRPYKAQRVLISSVAVLNPTFDDGDLYFTGPQIEIMRNLVQYANRPENYAAEWELGYYLIPDDDDWDDIQAIVADLEEVLMGNPNTLWGYKDRYAVQNSRYNVEAGTSIMSLGVIPAGKVYKVSSLSFHNADSVCSKIQPVVVCGPVSHLLETVYSLPAGAVVNVWCDTVLMEGDYIYVAFYDCIAGDDLFVSAIGYGMDVPT